MVFLHIIAFGFILGIAIELGKVSIKWLLSEIKKQFK